MLRISVLLSLIIAPLGLAQPKKDDFDRLDGRGASGKRVDVIEWEGNLEIHVYPKGSLAGLALKIDEPSKDKKVMVIGYRFNEKPKEQLIRRAILGVKLREGFKVYNDPSGDEYDKVIITNNTLSGTLTALKLDPEPKLLYPEGHPAIADGTSGTEDQRKPAQQKNTTTETTEAPKSPVDESGTIQPFKW
jgi:hypothetical protein